VSYCFWIRREVSLHASCTDWYSNILDTISAIDQLGYYADEWYLDGVSQNPPPNPSPNRNAIDHYPSRPAPILLRDYINRLQTLEWIPFPINGGKGIRSSSDGDRPQYEEIKQLFISNGWPDNFSGTAFAKAAAIWEEARSVRYGAEQYEKSIKYLSEALLYALTDLKE
jgi:hypothetical protein